MTEPNRKNIRLTAQEAWDAIASSRTGIFTTLRRDGMPVAMPVWFVAIDRRIYIATRGKKLVRINHDPRASFLVEAGDAWGDLRGVHLTGTAQLIEPESERLAMLQRLRREKYDQVRVERSAMPEQAREGYNRAGGGIVEFIPDDRILSWDNRRLGM
ncbi:MAG: pyridoxamine 5'-phosphate oxidase family protein [Acidimicrobiia bacterium]